MDTWQAHAWQFMHPPVQCHARGWLEVGDGHLVYWEECGNPLGRPALFLHGGPGVGCSADDCRWFDPRRWRIVLFDQRGSGRSLPLGTLAANTTAHLVEDIERLREYLGVTQWLLFGGSWGSTLALAYALDHRSRVSALVLRGVFLATAAERQGLYSAQGAAVQRPAAWQRFTEGRSDTEATEVLAALATRLHCGDAAIELTAACAWVRWEQELMAGEAEQVDRPDATPTGVAATALAAAAARIGVHYAQNEFFLDEDLLLDRAPCLAGLPGVIVQGALDLVTPPAAALALHRAWPDSRLQLIGDAGHASSHPSMARELVAATDALADAGVPAPLLTAAAAPPHWRSLSTDHGDRC